MTFLFLDLEWNEAFYPPQKRFVNEIVEIGAVKLNEDLQEAGAFSRIVRSAITDRLSRRFRELTGMANEEMRAGVPLADALRAFGEWCGDDFLLLTWSRSDLYAMAENCGLFAKNAFPEVPRYADFQAYVESVLRRRGVKLQNQISLAHAAGLFGIDTSKFTLHRAAEDCRVCAELLRACYDEAALHPFILDASGEDFLRRATFRPHNIDDIHSPYIRRGDLMIQCPRCRNYAKRISGWSYKQPFFNAQFRCRPCKIRFTGLVSFRKTDTGVKIRRKIEKLTEIPPEEPVSAKPAE